MIYWGFQDVILKILSSMIIDIILKTPVVVCIPLTVTLQSGSINLLRVPGISLYPTSPFFALQDSNSRQTSVVAVSFFKFQGHLASFWFNPSSAFLKSAVLNVGGPLGIISPRPPGIFPLFLPWCDYVFPHGWLLFQYCIPCLVYQVSLHLHF